MKNWRRLFIAALMATVTSVAGAVELAGKMDVNVTSDTAAQAKTKAFNQARRQIIVDVLTPYALPDLLRDAVKEASSDVLTNMIASSSIDGEKFSDTTYSAKITMTVDADAARSWLTEQGVQNWIPTDDAGDVFVTVVNMRNRVADWASVNQVARNEKINLATQLIAGNQVTIQVPTSVRTKFIIALREAGWRTENRDGVLHISR